MAVASTGLAALVLVGSAAWLATSGDRTPRARFEHWLEGQPGLSSVELLPGPRADGDVARPDAEVGTTQPLTTERVERFMRALEAYATGHPEAVFSTVQLHHGPDRVLVAGSHDQNTEVVTQLRALRALPDLYAVDIGIAPYPPHVTAVLTTGSDLVAAAATLTRGSVLGEQRSAPWRGAGITVRGEGLPHTVTVHALGVAPSARAASAFAVATRLEGRSPVELVVQGSDADDTWTGLRLDEQSRTAASTRSAVNALGFGMPGHHERVTGGPFEERDAPFDTAAWQQAALPPVRAVPGVVDARLEDPNTTPLPVLDVRASDPGVLDRLAPAVPGTVDVVAVHTATHAPDHDRKAALPPDPETSCPAGAGGSLNAAYTGPPADLRRASAFLRALRAAPGITCVHWWEPGQGHAFRGQQVDVRVPLEGRSWEPVLDAVLAERRLPGSVRPDVGVILVPRGRPWTALLLLQAGQDRPYPSTLAASTSRDFHEATQAQQPLVDYWDAALARR